MSDKPEVVIPQRDELRSQAAETREQLDKNLEAFDQIKVKHDAMAEELFAIRTDLRVRLTDDENAKHPLNRDKIRFLGERLAQARKDTELLEWLDRYIYEGFNAGLVTTFHLLNGGERRSLREALGALRAKQEGGQK